LTLDSGLGVASYLCFGFGLKKEKKGALSTQTKNRWGNSLMILGCIKERERTTELFQSGYQQCQFCQREEGLGFVWNSCGFRLTFLEQKQEATIYFCFLFAPRWRIFVFFWFCCVVLYKSMLKPHPQDRYFLLQQTKGFRLVWEGQMLKSKSS